MKKCKSTYVCGTNWNKIGVLFEAPRFTPPTETLSVLMPRVFNSLYFLLIFPFFPIWFLYTCFYKQWIMKFLVLWKFIHDIIRHMFLCNLFAYLMSCLWILLHNCISLTSISDKYLFKIYYSLCMHSSIKACRVIFNLLYFSIWK